MLLESRGPIPPCLLQSKALKRALAGQRDCLPGRELDSTSRSHPSLAAVADFPATAIALLTPFSAAPAGELRTIDHAALAILEHPVLPIAIARVNAKRLNLSGIGIFAESGVPHSESDVASCQFFETRCHIDIAVGGAVASLQNLVLPIVTIAVA